MASKMAKRTAKTKAQSDQATGQIRLESRSDTPSYYVNFVAVSHSPYDFTLSVAKIPSPLPQELLELAKGGKPIPLEATLQIILPPLLMEGLIKALIDQKEKHEKTLQQQVRKNELDHQHIKLPRSIN